MMSLAEFMLVVYLTYLRGPGYATAAMLVIEEPVAPSSSRGRP